MSSQIKKILLISSSILIGLSIATPNIVNAKTHNHHIQMTRIKHSSMYKIAVNLARKDSHKMDNYDGENNYLFKIMEAHPYYHHFSSFNRVYFNELMKLYKYNDKSLSVLTNVKLSINAMRQFLPKYQKLSSAEKQAFNLAPTDRPIPKRYRHNIPYARDYILGTVFMNNVDNQSGKKLTKHPSINQIVDYHHDAFGQVPYKYITNGKRNEIIQAVTNIINKSNANAWTDKQVIKYNKKVMKSLHLNSYYTKEYKKFFSPEDEDYNAPDVGSARFCQNVDKHYHHQPLYYPKSMDGGRSAGTYEGEIIYRNNNSNVRQTIKDFRKYMRDYMIYHAAKDCDDSPSKSYKTYMDWWNSHYMNKNYAGRQSSFAQWRLIYNRRWHNSSIKFISPRYGWNYYLVKN